MDNQKSARNAVRAFEYVRIAAVFIGFCLAFSYPQAAAHYLVLGVVLPLTGLLAVEGLFLAEASARYKGRQPSVYQQQSVLFELSLFTVAVAVVWMHAGLQAQLAVITVTLLGFVFSGLVHLWEFLHKAPRINLWRFVGSIMMAMAALIAVSPQLQV